MQVVMAVPVQDFMLPGGAGPAVVEAFEKPVRGRRLRKRLVEFKFRHKVDQLVVDGQTGAAVGVRGQILEPSGHFCDVENSRKAIDSFELKGAKDVITSGGIGGNVELVKNWPVDRLGPQVPRSFVIGVTPVCRRPND